MNSSHRRRLAAVGAAVLAIAGTFTGASSAAAWSQVNDDPTFIQVYDNNIENLETPDATKCPGDWQDLIYYMKTYETSPDLFLVQQLAGPGELNALLEKLNTTLVGVYDGILAVSDPEWMASPCGAEKDHQTNAIIWRVGRFNLVEGSKVTWQSYAKNGDPDCGLNGQDRTINVGARFWDKIARKYVAAASIHWPTAGHEGPACASMNAAKAAQKVEAIGGALTIWGGDANYSDQADGAWRGWYSDVNGALGGQLGYKDAAYDYCAERFTGGAAIRDCTQTTHWTGTGSGQRIDYLFARKGGGGMPYMGSEHTITFDEGDQADIQVTGSDNQSLGYSGHRAIRARIRY